MAQNAPINVNPISPGGDRLTGLPDELIARISENTVQAHQDGRSGFENLKSLSLAHRYLGKVTRDLRMGHLKLVSSSKE